MAVGAAADGGGVSLDVALLAVIAEQGVDLVARPHGPEHSSILHHWRLTTRHWREENTLKSQSAQKCEFLYFIG